MTDMTPATLVEGLTLEEQVSLLSGADFWSTPAIGRLGIGSLRVTDGPNGARGAGSWIGAISAAAFPVGISLGATWDRSLLSEIGAALAEEVKDKGAHVLLGPTVNLQRGALNGRNFECYAEDPVLTAALAVAYIGGLQGQRVGATVKHFVANESEFQRTTMSSEVDERTLRELYLVPFEAAVKEAHAWAVMSSYNRLNGTFTSEHGWLLTDVLRRQWGFDGVVMSDWFGSHSTAETMRAGLDLEMPGPTRDRGAALVRAVEAGTVPRDAVRQAALNMLRLLQRTGALQDARPHEEKAVEREATRALIRRAGARGTVLLTNDGTLPLAGVGKIAVIGPNAKAARCMGGGSSQLKAHRQVSPWEGLAAAVGEGALLFAPGCDNHRYAPELAGPLRAEWFANDDFSGTPVHVETLAVAHAMMIDAPAGGRVDPKRFSLRITGRYVPEADGRHRIGVYAAGRARVLVDGCEVVEAWESWTRGSTFFEEGCDERIGEVEMAVGRSCEIVILFQPVETTLMAFSAYHVGIGLPMADAEIAEAVRVAAEAQVAVLCVGRNGEWDSEGADLPSMTLPGRQNELIEAVAAVAERTVVVLQTGGPVEMPWVGKVSAVVQAWYPGQEAGHAVADVLLGHVEPGGRLPQSFPHRLDDTQTQGGGGLSYPGVEGRVRYAEGLLVGYRHHEANAIAPLFPFGHGLGYAAIDIEAMVVEGDTFSASATVALRVTLANRGQRKGSQVVQVYVSPDAAPVERPPSELKAFTRIDLSPGETGDVVLRLDPRDFAWYCTRRSGWIVSPGEYALRAGLSADDRRFVATVARQGELVLPV